MANRTIVTPEGRLSFPHIYEPSEDLAGNLVYSLTLLIPKNADPGIAVLKQAWDACLEEEFGSTDVPDMRPFLSKKPKEDKGWIKDGDEKYAATPADKKPEREYLRGMWIVPVKTPEEKKPLVVDENKNEIMDKSLLQGGDYIRCVLELSAYTNKKLRSPQLSVRLVVVQKTKTGKRFGGGVSADAALEMLEAVEAPDLDSLGL